jgi:ABC-2 type transport system permease protein
MESPAIYFKGLFSKEANLNNSLRASAGPFSVMMRKEVADHVRSWRFIILVVLIVLTFLGAMYVSMSHIRLVVANEKDPDHLFIYLKLLTTTDGTLPPFHVFISFLGPLLGIALGFDAVNAEKNNGTLTRLLAQPVYRDNLLLAKFSGALIVISVLFVSLCLLMIGGGLIITGVPIEPVEFFRIIGFIIISILYVGFWLSLSILLSVVFKRAATSALTAIGIWLFFTVFYSILVHIIATAVLPDKSLLDPETATVYENYVLNFLRVAPNQLYTDATTTLLMPSIRSLGPMTMEQMAGAIPSPLPLKESFMIVWPEITGLISAITVCFALTYYLFMRKEIRT